MTAVSSVIDRVQTHLSENQDHAVSSTQTTQVERPVLAWPIAIRDAAARSPENLVRCPAHKTSLHGVNFAKPFKRPRLASVCYNFDKSN